MLLSFILLPVTITSYGNDVEARIKELEQKYFEKELEISDLGKMIAERDEILRCARQNIGILWDTIKRQKADAIARKHGKDLSEEEFEQVGIIMQASLNEFVKQFVVALGANQEIKGMLTKGLYDQENIDSATSFESARFILTRAILEHMLLEKLVAKYEACVEELIKFSRELTALKNRSTHEIY